MRSPRAQVWLLALSCLSTRFAAIEGGKKTVGPEEACVDFAVEGKNSASGWTLADCTEVWTQFVSTVPSGLRKRLDYADVWRETADELRRAGTPCLASSSAHGDGVGSTTIRILSSWFLADEMGCDWVTPDWGRRPVVGGNGTVLYCHQIVDKGKNDLVHQPVSALKEMVHCSVVDWLSFFQLSVPSVDLPEGAKIKEIKFGWRPNAVIDSTKLGLHEDGFADQGWDRVMFKYSLSFASRHMMAAGNWEEDRRQRLRAIIGQARENFHLHPRPWYDENPECAYDPTRLNFAIHIRMGDRRDFVVESLDYFHHLELLMDTVSQEVVGKGLEPPLFHVFSETFVPCPSDDTGMFDEFPTWPVHQVPGCLTAEVPDDCPEKQAGLWCAPERSGTFDVIGRPLVLHVGPDVHNALSCMIQADGLLMGCSTFGQIAGIFSRGIKFFSMHCSGARTPSQYKMIPPIALAERGHLWVPVEGNWYVPVFNSSEILNGALDTHLGNRGRV